ncbi:DUF551 domain-containing protein [Escherichia coli]|uniref:DUF551 domain-containing protein n=2 Tax=Escherichia coli TaxID=562 RepID=A0AAQ2I719_ECOLX|nr:DUF551 domain-containing protein [Escherichia coli]EEY1570617.1 DUF551 domain-containing protein [Escherichia coli O21]EFB4120707.1 DUF551 domain-containing protein [Escherichia coli O5]HBC3022642.1 DUF551 domain-containing protein [Escherichia coli O146]HDQ6517570.1 DUF551 domain-containing protein [Escherichia coli O113:H4]HDQ6579772.1 DUF551 domain-containing protein [Escherichia coli O146:H21]HDQ6627407.1 DUF551 domain-containing protein [Escherichia coli O128:H2]HDQ6859017.1 DUF551 d
MTTFTDEDKELIKEIRERIGSLDVRDNIERRAYEIALASLEAEAVCVIDQSNLDYLEAGYDADVWPVSRAEMADVFLYRAVPPVPDKIALAIENLKQKLVECNRYNYCADAVKGVEDAYLAAMRHGPEPVSQTCKLNELSSNSPVTPARWISCSTRIPAQDDWILIYSKHGEYMAGQVQGEYVELSDGTLSWLGNALFWMPLPEPPKEVRQ